MQQLPDIARVIINAEASLMTFFKSIRRQRITPSGPIRTLFHKRGQFGPLLMRQPRRWFRCLLVDKTNEVGSLDP
jgi:hypothetical protein